MNTLKSYERCISTFVRAIIAMVTVLISHVACLDAATLDHIYLRDGTTIKGLIISEAADSYRVQLQTPDRVAPIITNVPIRTIKYTLYGDKNKARQALRLDHLNAALGLKTTASVTILPTEAFGEELVRAVKSARQRIYIFAYYVTGSRAPLISEFYDLLRAKAKAGVDVRIIAEFGKSTPMPVRNDTKNFVADLAVDGIKVGFIQDRKVLHKKMILIDSDKVILGSSNLTAAGVGVSDEINILVRSPEFAQHAATDFMAVSRVAKSARQLFQGGK